MFIGLGPGPRRAPGDLVGGQVRMGPHPGEQPQELDGSWFASTGTVLSRLTLIMGIIRGTGTILPWHAALGV
jgi:hypothetical protein